MNVNALTHYIVTSLDRDLACLPGATSISFHKRSRWSYLLVSTSTDAIESVSASLDLGPPVIKTGTKLDGNPLWWRCATSRPCVTAGTGLLQIDVNGPVFYGTPER